MTGITESEALTIAFTGPFTGEKNNTTLCYNEFVSYQLLLIHFRQQQPNTHKVKHKGSMTLKTLFGPCSPGILLNADPVFEPAVHSERLFDAGADRFYSRVSRPWWKVRQAKGKNGLHSLFTLLVPSLPHTLSVCFSHLIAFTFSPPDP